MQLLSVEGFNLFLASAVAFVSDGVPGVEVGVGSLESHLLVDGVGRQPYQFSLTDEGQLAESSGDQRVVAMNQYGVVPPAFPHDADIPLRLYNLEVSRRDGQVGGVECQSLATAALYGFS